MQSVSVCLLSNRECSLFEHNEQNELPQDGTESRVIILDCPRYREWLSKLTERKYRPLVFRSWSVYDIVGVRRQLGAPTHYLVVLYSTVRTFLVVHERNWTLIGNQLEVSSMKVVPPLLDWLDNGTSLFLNGRIMVFRFIQCPWEKNVTGLPAWLRVAAIA